MTIQLLAFGIARDICGARSQPMEIPEQCDITALKALLETQFPPLHELASWVLAVNENYIQDNTTLMEGDEVAILPPVSGG
jgi:molybdopterin synthase sulfur carrier subunit